MTSLDPDMADVVLYRCTKCDCTRCTIETSEDPSTLLCPLDGRDKAAPCGAPAFHNERPGYHFSEFLYRFGLHNGVPEHEAREAAYCLIIDPETFDEPFDNGERHE